MVSVQARQEQVSYAINRGLSSRRACALLKVSRSGLYYKRKMPSKDAPIVAAMKKISSQYPRFGSRRVRVLLARKGIMLGKEKCARIWAGAQLQVPKKRRQKRRITSAPMLSATTPNSVWSYDFVHDACANGQKLKCLTVVDEFTRECLAIEVGSSIRSERVIEVLSRLMTLHGVPSTLRSDNGPEFVSTALLTWVTEQKLGLMLIEPGKPWQNGKNESFNGKFRDECLAMEWFRNRVEAKVVIEQWRQHYNAVRPHSSLGYKTPFEFKTDLEKINSNGAGFSRLEWS